MPLIFHREISPNLSQSFPPWTVPCARRHFLNSSSITYFLLLAFADAQELQLLHFWLFLGICLADLLGIGLIITAIDWDHNLHNRMYIFRLTFPSSTWASPPALYPKP